MTQASLFNPINNSRLISELLKVNLIHGEPTHIRFGERLGKLIEFSNSFALADAHYYISKMTWPVGAEDNDQLALQTQEIVNEFLRVRELLVRTIIKSFHPDKRTRFKLPMPNEDDPPEASFNYEPYRRFYAIQQREMDGHIQPLRKFVRDTIEGISLPLKKLASLDEAMGNTLQPYASKQLAQLPKALETHFIELQQRYSVTQNTLAQSLEKDGWLTIFARDLQVVLLAELDFRLLPITGMIEALHTEVNKSND